MLSALIIAATLSTSCHKEVTTCRFWGTKNTQFSYDSQSYTIPQTGVLEIIVESDNTCASIPESKILFMGGNSQTPFGTVNRVFIPKDAYWTP